jgi:hypothetical protein
MGAALSLLAAIGAAPASATLSRSRVGSFTTVEGSPISAAFDNSSGPSGGDLYTANLFVEGILKFTATGTFTGVKITGAETPQESLVFVGEGAAGGLHLAQVAVDGSGGLNSGDPYLADTGGGVVDKFSEEGKYICQITGAATPSVSECDPLGSKTPGGSMTPSGVAVGANGNVYVSDAAHDVIDVFSPGGAYLTQYADPKEEPGSLAINAAGDLYVANGSASEPTGVLELSTEKGGSVVPDGELETAQDGLLAVDRATGEVMAGPIGGGVGDFEASGAKLGTFGEEEGALAPAVDDASGEVYAKNGLFAGEMIIYGPFTLVPNEVTTSPASEVGEEAATLHGHVIPDSRAGGEISECDFQYVTEAQFNELLPSGAERNFEGAATAACEQAVPQPAGAEVTAKVTLTPDTTYYFRLVANDAGTATYAAGFTRGAAGTLTTVGPPVIEDQSATPTTHGVSLSAEIDSYGFATTCQLQYVDEADFKASKYADATAVPCAPETLAAGLERQAVEVQLSGLPISSGYHYRFVATNGSKAKTTDGADETFSTFGIKEFKFETLTAEGNAYTQAGGHPYVLKTSFQFYTGAENKTEANLKDVETELPPGLVGNPQATAKCTREELTLFECPGTAQVGVLTLYENGGGLSGDQPIYNLVPPGGTPAEFGARINTAADVYIDSSVRSGADYGITATVSNASTGVGVTGAMVEIWGVPAEASHNAQRECPTARLAGERHEEKGPCSSTGQPTPLLTEPTVCTEPETARLRLDAWQAAGEYLSASAPQPQLTGCNKIQFAPGLSVLPDTSAADSPSGITVNLTVPQNEAPNGLASSEMRNAVVTLPEGVTVNPASANGLQACSEEEIGLDNAKEPTCPDASKIGSVEIETPLLPTVFKGSVYLAQEHQNPFGSLIALYVTAEGEGVLIKVAGKTQPCAAAGEVIAGRTCGAAGQLITTFENNPQLPFNDFRLHFFGGPRAPLATPLECGNYSSTAVLTPWSAPESGSPASISSPFSITTGPGGGPCSGAGGIPFNPSFTAGTTSVQAGGFTPFTLTMGREDGEQNLGTIKTALPSGLTGVLNGVPLCPEPQASEGDCSAASQIGHVVTGVGEGPFPLFVPGPGTTQDAVYLTGPYKGAPFGLSVVVPAEAGPFNLDENGRPVVVRAKVSINPITAQVTVESDPLPQMLQGIPLDIRDVNVVIERSKFLVNPTDCDPTHIGATLTSAGGIVAEPSVPFQVTDCAALKFTPSFTASSSAKTSKRLGASLHVHLGFPEGSLGAQANIHEVKVELPKQLPARQVTLNHACLVKVFEESPAKCPSASRVGYAKAITPILPVPLEGPAYFVSYGGAKFPELVVVLQGYGITIYLHGETFINEKTSVISSTFKTVPDQPVESFELTLPQGEYSALAANGSLCASPMSIPTTFLGQNGMEFEQSTPVSVSGCKPKLTVLRHSVKGDTVSVTVKTPAAGRLSATGDGLVGVSAKVGKARMLTMRLTLAPRDVSLIARHPGRKLRVTLKLRFTPNHGRPVTGQLSVLMR